MWLITWYANWWQPKPRDVSKDNTYSCGILLGGFASPDENNNGYFNATSDRFIQIVKLYQQKKIQHILISGGNGKRSNKDFTEGDWVRKELHEMGIPDSVILYEDKSNNTAENAANTKKLLDTAGLKAPYLLVTSAYHMPRASLIFKNAGVKTVSFPCNYTVGNAGYHLDGIIPSPENLLSWDKYLKESAAYVIYKIKG
ncbi:YdcF family protein [Ferruginibacter sp. SUN002]|uniref:YdcF family protein n=1 Tax=Ferruginibacter sp. SUN002 TaxID=2937789 RepID=UPI003D35BDB4